MKRLFVGVITVGAIVGVFACSSSDDNTGSSSGTSGTSGGTSSTSGAAATGNLTGSCATLKNCCPTLETSKQRACNYAADNSQNNASVCDDALNSYPTCSGGGGTSSSSSSSGSSGCGPAGADPVDMPADCAPLAGACIFHENETVEHGAKIVCIQYSGQFSQIKDAAGKQCTNGHANHEWKVDQKCSDVVQNIQAGCENHASGAFMCTTSYYGQGCVTGGGKICNSETSTNGVWVKP